MTPRRRGHIVNMASTMGEASVPGLISYNASKAAAIRSPTRPGWNFVPAESNSRRCCPER